MDLLSNFSGKLLEAGVDEVGRGAISGPVVAAAVILAPGFTCEGLTDSKKMKPAAREKASELIWSYPGNMIGVGMATVEEIDAVNILNATYIAMHRALGILKICPDFIIVDGDRFRQYADVPYECVVKGDGKYLAIAAASVVAKVYRDRLMVDESVKYPGYKWDNNKGYGTKDHYAGLEEIGPSPLHRKTFL